MKIILDDNAFTPERAHDTDAGLDLKAMYGATIRPHSGMTFNTGVHVELPRNTAGLLVAKSGLNINHSIISTGLIDEGYTGEIVVKLYNHGDVPYTVHDGDKITQLVIIPVLYEKLEYVEDFDVETDRADNGFGSTGR